MKPHYLAAILLGSLAFLPATLSSHPFPKDSQQKNSSQNSGASSKDDKLPYPNVPRITAEETERLAKDNNVIIVDTDDSESYAAEHIKGSVNVTYDPTTDIREQDQTLSALPGNKMIVFYCNCPHEEDAAPFVQEMWELGYDRDKVKAMQGGLTRWEQLHYPLVGTAEDQGGNVQKGN